jgi:hypothetical protein
VIKDDLIKFNSFKEYIKKKGFDLINQELEEENIDDYNYLKGRDDAITMGLRSNDYMQLGLYQDEDGVIFDNDQYRKNDETVTDFLYKINQAIKKIQINCFIKSRFEEKLVF